MSDVIPMVHVKLEQLVEEIVAQRTVRVRRRVDPYRSHYAGLRRAPRSKYSDCEYVGPPTMRVRKLTDAEIEQLQAHVQRCVEERS